MSRTSLVVFAVAALSAGPASANPPPRVQIPLDLGATPKVVDAGQVLLDRVFYKQFRNVDMSCASAISAAPVLEFELPKGISKDFRVWLDAGKDGLLVQAADGRVWVDCSQTTDQSPSLQWLREGWAPGVYRVYAVARFNPPRTTDVKVSFAVVPHPESPAVAFQKACFADYADFREKWGPVETRTHAAMDKLAGKDFYAAYGKLRELYLGLAKEAKRLKLGRGASIAQAIDDGLAFEVASAITKLQRDHGIEYAQPFSPAGFGRGHANTGDETYDRNHYCARAWNLGTHRTNARQLDRAEHTIITPWLADADNRAFYAREVALFKQSEEAMRIGTSTGMNDHDYGEVTSVEKHGKSVTLRLAHSETPYSCHQTDRILRIQPDGEVQYVVDCESAAHSKVLYTLSVTFPAGTLPVETPIRKGDSLSFVGERTGSGDHEVWKGAYLSSIDRDGKQIGDWSFDYPQLFIP